MTSRGFFLVKIAKSREELNLHLTYNNHCHMTKTWLKELNNNYDEWKVLQILTFNKRENFTPTNFLLPIMENSFRINNKN